MSFQKILRVARFLQPHEINEVLSGNKTSLKFSSYDLASILAKKIGFSFEVVLPKDGQSGKLLPNGSWTGIVGMVQRGEADLAMYVPLSEDKLTSMDLSYPYEISPVTFAVRKPEYTRDITTFLKPFSISVWTSFILCFFVTALLIHFLFYRKLKIQKLILYMFGSVSNQQMPLHPENTANALWMSGWIIGVAFLVYSYAAVLLSFLTVPSLSGVRTIPELKKAILEGKYYCATWPGAYVPIALSNSFYENSRIVRDCLMKGTATADMEGFLANKLPKMKPAVISVNQALYMVRKKYFISEDTFFSMQFGIAIRKNFCYKAEIDNMLSYIWVSGLYPKMYDEFVKRLQGYETESVSDETVDRPLSVKDLEGVFLLLIGGNILSITAFIFEIIVGKCDMLQMLPILDKMSSKKVTYSNKTLI